MPFAKSYVLVDCGLEGGLTMKTYEATETAYKNGLEAERDQAVKDCGCFPCQTCEERENGDLCRMCEIEGGYRSFHQWRGVQKEE